MSDIQDAMMQGMILGQVQSAASAARTAVDVALIKAKSEADANVAYEESAYMDVMKELTDELEKSSKNEEQLRQERDHYRAEFQKAQKGYDDLLRDYNCDVRQTEAERDAALNIIKANIDSLPYENYDEVRTHIIDEGMTGLEKAKEEFGY